MGEAKIKKKAAFPAALIAEWEAEDCVNFAIALARQTAWLLHVDWWSESIDPDHNLSIEQLIPLRVYVADNHDRIFDVRGVKSISDFNQSTTISLARSRARGNGGVATRFYHEDKLVTLPLRVAPVEAKIVRALEAIRANPAYLASIPERTAPFIPAADAARYMYGLCAPFAEAISQIKGGIPTALLAVRFSPSFEGTRRGESGYFHSVVVHPDGTGEDAWGKAPVGEIATRFGVIEFITSVPEHTAKIETFKKASAEKYQAAFTDACHLIRTHSLS